MPKYKLITANQRKMLSVMRLVKPFPLSSLKKDEFIAIRDRFKDQFNFLDNIDDNNYVKAIIAPEALEKLRCQLLSDEQFNSLSTDINHRILFISKAEKNRIENDVDRTMFLITKNLPKIAKDFSIESAKSDIRSPTLPKINSSGNLFLYVRDIFYNEALSHDEYHFTQGDFESRVFTEITPQKHVTETLGLSSQEKKEYNPILAFGYIDDNGVACAVSLSKIGYDSYKYFFSFTRNCNAPELEQREQTIIYDPEYFEEIDSSEPDCSLPAILESGIIANSANSYFENDLNSSKEVYDVLIQLLNSKDAASFVSQVFDNNGYLLPDKFEICQSVLDNSRREGYFNLYHSLCVDNDIAPRYLEWEDLESSAYKKLIMDLVAQISDPIKRKQATISYLQFFFSELKIINKDELLSLAGDYLNDITKSLLLKSQEPSDILIKSKYYCAYLDCISCASFYEKKMLKTKIEKITTYPNALGNEVENISSIAGIIGQTKSKVYGEGAALNFDPQGRLLVAVDEHMVSFDVSKDKELLEKYYTVVKEALLNNEIQNIDNIIDALRNLKSKSSIICLQQEMYMQISLALEVYKKQFCEISENFVISPEIEQKINEEVMNKFAYALDDAYKNDEISLEKLNSKLDDARTEIAKKSHDILVKTLVSNFPSIDLTKFNLKKAHKDAAITPATTKNILHIDNYLNTATEIEGSKYTSHYRKTGNEFAHRAIKTFRINDELEVIYQLEGTQIRTPSLPVKKGLTEQEYINDTKDKIKKLDEQYGFSKPYTYNLLTAMQDRLDDLKGTNKQTQSARHIILGAHASNRAKIKRGERNLCLVQAISINGFGRPLGYRRFGFSINLPNEATLLAEMSIIYNIEGSNILFSYENFLKPKAPTGFLGKIFNYFKSPYFVTSQEGKELRESIVKRKKLWQKNLPADKDNIKDLVKKSLQKIMAFDLHFSHDYAKMIQSFSIFIEDDSIISCKSSNERTIIIMLREMMLKKIDIPENLQQALINVASATTKKDAVTALNKLKNEINKNYNEYNLYGAHAMISLVDQGAGHKIAENKNGSWNRNKAEDKGITNLKQKHTRGLQAHNELADYMNAAVNNNKNRQSLSRDTQSSAPSSYARSLQNLGGSKHTYEQLQKNNDVIEQIPPTQANSTVKPEQTTIDEEGPEDPHLEPRK